MPRQSVSPPEIAQKRIFGWLPYFPKKGLDVFVCSDKNRE